MQCRVDGCMLQRNCVVCCVCKQRPWLKLEQSFYSMKYDTFADVCVFLCFNLNVYLPMYALFGLHNFVLAKTNGDAYHGSVPTKLLVHSQSFIFTKYFCAACKLAVKCVIIFTACIDHVSLIWFQCTYVGRPQFAIRINMYTYSANNFVISVEWVARSNDHQTPSISV